MLRMFVLMILSMHVGTSVLNFLSKTPLNIWISRSVGALVTGLVMALLYKLYMNNKRHAQYKAVEE